MKNFANKKIGLKQGQNVAFIAAGVTLLLAVMKGFIGYVFNSRILVADAFHSCADLLAIFASGVGLWLASREKSSKFPYGLYKAETLMTLIIGILIVWAGVEVLLDGYEKLFTITTKGVFPFLPVSVSIISMVVAYFIARKEKAVGKLINSRSLEANAKESFLDIFTSLMVLVGLVLGYAQVPYMEGVIIVFISLLIIKLGFENIWTSLLVLMDANLEPLLQSEIKEKINEIYGVKGVGEVKIRQTGPFKMIECKIETSPTLPLYRAHELADKVEESIISKYKQIESVFIHIEPEKEEKLSVIIPVKEINGLDSRVHGHFGRAPYFIFLKICGNDITIEDFYYNEFLNEKKYIGIKVIKAVIKHKIDLLFCSSIGEISFYMLKDSFVDIHKVEVNFSVKEAIDKYRKHQLEAITFPTHSLEESLVEHPKVEGK